MVMGKEHMVDGDVVDYDGDKIPFPGVDRGPI
jgi:hypothetical protein